MFKSVALIVTAVCVGAVVGTSAAFAETYHCRMDRQISVGGNGMFEDNKEYNKGREFYLAIDNSTQRGTFSTCTVPAGCSTNADVWAVRRWEAKSSHDMTNRVVKLIVGSSGQIGMVWSIEQWFGEKDFTAIAASVQGQRSDSWFGTCKKVID